MAANWKNTQGIAGLGKRLVNQIWTSNSLPSASPLPPLAAHTFRRAAHTTVYDKNLDEEVRPNVVPDDVIQPHSDKYWAPHPSTGVFGPATDNHQVVAGASPVNGTQDSVLEEKAWFRPTSLEDLEKPHQP